MGKIEFEKFSINRFWEKTPTVLKFFLIITLFCITIYLIYNKYTTNNQLTELSDIEESIKNTYQLINRFDEFRIAQYTYNEELISYLENMNLLIVELNESTNRKFIIMLTSNTKMSEAEKVKQIMQMQKEFDDYNRYLKEHSIKKIGMKY